jgi:von Willebrand factor type A domain
LKESWGIKMGKLTNPIAAILAAASESKPSADSQARASRATGQSSSAFDLQLIDCSGSMGETTESGQTKISIVQDILAQLPWCPCNIAFNSSTRLITYSDKLVATGGTNMALGVLRAAQENPRKVLIVSDGCPDNESAAFDAAEKLAANISCFFVGDDGDHHAKEFLRNLAKKWGGIYEDCDISQLSELQRLSQKIQLLLPPTKL